MATCNFWLKNAQSYYAFNDTYKTENDEGEEVEVTRDECEWDDLLDCICYRGEEGKFFTCPSTETYNRRMEARNICETNTEWLTFGNGNAWTTETNVESVIVIRSGYYEGAVLDYDVKVETSQGDTLHLSDYDNVDISWSGKDISTSGTWGRLRYRRRTSASGLRSVSTRTSRIARSSARRIVKWNSV